MLPFLKNRKEGSAAAESEPIRREGDDEGEELNMLDAIAGDMIEAFKKSDRSLLKSALDALVEHIKYEDQIQDKEEI